MNGKLSRRIDIIDALRGFAVVLMVVHHLLYDLVEFLDAPEWLFTNPVFDVLHYIFAGLFILLSGVSSNFSRSNVKRGLKVIAIAAAITVVTYFMDMPIWFGILHLLGFAMLFYGITRKIWDLPLLRNTAPLLYVLLITASAVAVSVIKTSVPYLWILGLPSESFYSYDYFPLLPWLFVFLLGTWLGQRVIENRFPAWFYDMKIRLFPAVGKKALIIYIVHQPLLYGFVMLLVYFRSAA